jgi:asparagine synthase (glutamine-hydrolysing)
MEGMFALVFFDANQSRLLAARDRFGIKPLYMLRHSGGIAFASELKQFLSIEGFRPRLNYSRASDFLDLGVTDHGRETMWQDVRAIPPGGCVEVQIEKTGALTIDETLWYRLPYLRTASANDAAGIADLRNALTKAVRSHADVRVPSAISLSGGLDSSAVACLAPQPLRCYSVTYDERAIDEMEFARSVAASRKSELIPVRIDNDELELIADAACWHLDEPFPTTTVLAQWAVFRAASRDRVKVMLTGQGADELLGGYSFLHGPNLIGLLRSGNFGALLREGFGQGGYASGLSSSLRAAGTAILPAKWLPKLVRSGWAEPGLARARLAVHRTGRRDFARAGLGAFRSDLLGPANLSMLLRYEDRTSMAHGIEARPPFLDVRVVESALRFQGTALMKQGLNKVPLRRCVADVLPRSVLERRDKRGFPTPESAWLRGPLRQYVRVKARAAHERFPNLVPASQLTLLDNALQEAGPLRFPIWRVASFGAWAERFNVYL